MNLRISCKTQRQMFLFVSAGYVGPHPDGPAPKWRLHTNLYKFGERASSHILHKENCCDLNLGESLFFQILGLIYRTGLILILIFYEWRDTEHQQYNSWQKRKRRHSICSKRKHFSQKRNFERWLQVLANGRSNKLCCRRRTRTISGVPRHKTNMTWSGESMQITTSTLLLVQNFIQDVACNAAAMQAYFGERAHLDQSSAILKQTRKRLEERRKCVLGSGS